MHRLLVVLLACTPALSACRGRGQNPLSNHAAAVRLAEDHPRSDVLPQADYIVAALDSGEVAPIVDAMTSKMADRYRDGRLEKVSRQVREHYGHPIGIVEERVHTERDLTWYSGLVLYSGTEARKRDREGKLLLFQFALENQRLGRLLVREHPFSDDVSHPADEYMTVNRFAFPSSDEWTVGHGGRDEDTNKHHRHRAQRFAYDIIIKRNGRSARGKRNEDAYCYGKILVAPAPGRVVFARDGVPENRPGERGDGGGNGVIIDHGFGERSSLWHMIPGSVRVKKGQRVEWGDELGRVGNSGRSTAPHIHFHVDTGSSKTGGFGLPAEFVDAVVDGDYHDRHMPIRGQRVRRSKAHRIHSPPRPLIDL